MKLSSLGKAFSFFRYVRILEKKVMQSYYLIVIDGPTSITVSNLIVRSEGCPNVRFVASAHYITRLNGSNNLLDKYMVGWRFSTLMQGVGRYLSLCSKIRRISEVGRVTKFCNDVCIESQIRCHADKIKKVIVFNERSSFTQLAVSTAKYYGIATACIQHGAVVENYFPVTVDCYFTWSDYYSNLLRQRVPGLMAVSVGRLGYKFPLVVPSVKKSDGPLLVLQPADVSLPKSELLSHFKTIIDVCYGFFDQITLRPHPNDNIINDIVNYIGDREYRVDKGDIGQALSRHEITISIYSTVLFEAAHYGSLPIQYIESCCSSDLMDRSEFQAGSPESLQSLMERLQDQVFFLKILDRAKLYAEERMAQGDIKVLFESLKN